MKKTIALMLSLMLLLAMGSVASAQEETHKTLTLAASSDLRTLGAMNMEQQNTLANRLVFECLAYYDDGVQPLLAESWSFNADGTELTIHLRQGVVFHDGSALNADVMLKWLDMHRGNATTAAFIMFDANIFDASKVDEYTVKIKFSTPYFHYIEDLCYADAMMLVAEVMMDAENNVITQANGNFGTGPYRIVEQTEEVLRLEKFDQYWGDLSAYPYDEIIIKTIPDGASRLLALQNGEVDMLYNSLFITPEQYQQGISLDGVEGKAAQQYAQTLNMAVNCAKPILSDVRVRQAVEYAIDKQALSDGLTYGLEAAAETLFPKDLPDCDVDTVTRAYDPEKAAALLEEAGWTLNEKTGYREKDGETLRLVFTYDSGEAINRPLSIALSSMLAEVGIELETSAQDIYVWWGDCVAGNYDLTLWNVSLEPHTVPNRQFISWPICTAQTPSLAALSDGADCMALIGEFSKTDDEARIAQIFTELFNYSADNVLNIPLLYTRDVVLYRTDAVSDYVFPDNTRFFEANRVTPAQ